MAHFSDRETSVAAEGDRAPSWQPGIGSPPWIDLRQYDQSWYSPGRSKWVVLLWWLVQGVVFPLTLHAHHAPRRWLLRWFGARIGQGVVIRPTARFHYPWKIEIGDYSWIGSGTELYSLGHIRIGNHCVVSQNTYLCTGSHDPSDRAFGLRVAPITIENGAWIAAACFVGPGVTVGANSIVGARSNVFADLPPGYICLGSPCKPHKPRSMDDAGCNWSG